MGTQHAQRKECSHVVGGQGYEGYSPRQTAITAFVASDSRAPDSEATTTNQRTVIRNTIEPLLTAADVSRILGVRTKRVYELDLPIVRISERSLRWKRTDVLAFIERRTEGGR